MHIYIYVCIYLLICNGLEWENGWDVNDDENEKWDGMRWGVVTYSEIYPIQIYYKLISLLPQKEENKKKEIKEKGKTINHHHNQQK